MKPVTNARHSSREAPLPPDAEPIELRELLALIGQTPPDLESWLLDRRAGDRAVAQ